MTMLADSDRFIQFGRFHREIHLPATAKSAIVDFIEEELPKWRDHAERPAAKAETTLTEHLCDYLNDAAYHSPVWSHIQFRTEIGDETHGNRKIDLAVKPLGSTLVIEGRRHTLFEALFPIECKRLPTPKGSNRDDREYVFTKFGTTGGIQRFKFGYHGATHTFAAMIAYVQEKSLSYWLEKVNCWVQNLSIEHSSAWTEADSLHLMKENLNLGISTLHSRHQRTGNLDPCEMRHIWIRMAEPTRHQ